MKSVTNRRKTIIQLLCIISLIAFSCGICFYYGSSQVDITDQENTEVNLVKEPVFSAESGFYEKPFYLSIDVPKNTKVYYTLDCSDPDTNSTLYEEPIYLENATNHENVFCMNEDVSTGFYVDLINSTEKYNENDEPPGYKSPDYNVEKCNVVRAIAVDKDGNYSKTVTKVFFVELSPLDYHNCNIVSIITDPKNLFDDEIGIYVTGTTFEEYLDSGEIGTTYFGKRWRFWNSNYRQRGKEWEREATISIMNENGIIITEKDIGIRIQGGISRGSLPKSLNIYSRKKYDNEKLFNVDLFNDGYYPSSINLSSGGNQLITQFNDYMMSKRANNLHFATMKFMPCVVFLDGEYWGFYWMTNRYDEEYIANYYDVASDNILMIKNGSIAIGYDEFQDLYSNMYTTISVNDMSDERNYEKACEIIDTESFVDYYATQIYISRSIDWPIDNYALWRTIATFDDTSYSDGKWRWMLFDSNSSSMRSDLLYDNSLEYVIEKDALFASLWNNPEFRNKFEERILQIADQCFDAETMTDFIDDYAETMYPILSKSWQRFYGKDNDKGEVFYQSMESYKQFFINRKKVVESWFDN